MDSSREQKQYMKNLYFCTTMLNLEKEMGTGETYLRIGMFRSLKNVF